MDITAEWHEYRGKIASYARSFPSLTAEDRQDIASKAFLRAWNHRSRFDSGRSFGTWIFSIARTVALDTVRKGRGHRKIESKGVLSFSEFDEKNHAASWPPEPSHAIIVDESTKFVRDYVGRLDCKDREIANLYYGQDRTVREIAKIVRQPEGTVKWRLSKIRDGLKAEWEAEYGK